MVKNDEEKCFSFLADSPFLFRVCLLKTSRSSGVVVVVEEERTRMRHSRVALLASLLAMGLTLGYLFLVELALDGEEPPLQAGARRLMANEGSAASRLSKLKLKMGSRAAARDKVEELKENILPADDVRGRSAIKEEVKLLAAKAQLREKIDALKEAPELTGELAGSPEYELRKSEMMAVRRHLEEQMRELADRDGSLHEMRLELAQLMRDLERAKEQSKLDHRPEEVDPVEEALALETEQQLAEVEEEIEATRHVFEAVKEQFLEEDQAEQREDQTERERLHALADSARKKEDRQREKAKAKPPAPAAKDATSGQDEEAEELAEQQSDAKQQQQKAAKEEKSKGKKKAGVFDTEKADQAMTPKEEEEEEQEQEQEQEQGEQEEEQQEEQDEQGQEQEQEQDTPMEVVAAAEEEEGGENEEGQSETEIGNSEASANEEEEEEVEETDPVRRRRH